MTATSKRNLTLVSWSGGGAKGTVYSGVHHALELTKIFEKLTYSSGASAGSFIAALSSFGMSSIDLRRQVIKTRVDKLLGEQVSNNPFSPYSGTPIFEFIRDNIHASAKKFIEPLKEPHYLKETLEDPLYELTFKDLDELHRLNPKRFKKLKLVVTNQITGQPEYVDSSTKPNAGIARTCQASCAIPGVLEKVIIDNTPYVDGALRDPVPIRGAKQEEILAISFGTKINKNKNPLYQALYGSRIQENNRALKKPKTLMTRLSDSILALYVPDYDGTTSEVKHQAFQNIVAFPLQYIEIRVGHLGTLDFPKATQYYSQLNAIGFLDTINYITNHELEDESAFNSEKFYACFVFNFIAIYKATLVASHSGYDHDPLLTKLSYENISNREQYYLIRESIEIEIQPHCSSDYFCNNNIDYAWGSTQAFAIALAYEYTTEIIKPEDLLKAITNRNTEHSLFNCFGFFSKEPDTIAISKALDGISTLNDDHVVTNHEATLSNSIFR